MKFGALLMPSHPPERSIRDGQRWDLYELDRLDALGFEEAWIGEHFTAAWEPCPAPDLLIAQALLRTKRIRLGPLGHLLPFHHPVELAHRVAYLDHMAEGRYQLGVGISVLPTDHALFALDVSHGRNFLHDGRLGADTREIDYCRSAVAPASIEMLDSSTVPSPSQIWIYVNEPESLAPHALAPLADPAGDRSSQR
jgi:alkanesulfonate monooxygenase SsuD/methylene tetrahydromethanopterin reductase-like flavin-dependent oxidoreductase (luciferase family)